MASRKDRTRLFAFQKDQVVAAWKMELKGRGLVWRELQGSKSNVPQRGVNGGGQTHVFRK